MRYSTKLHKDALNKKRERWKPHQKHRNTNDGGQTHVWWFGGLQANTAGNSHYDKVGQPKKRPQKPTAPCAPWCLAGSVILTSCRFMTSLSRILNHSDIELLEPNCIAIVLYVSYVFIYVYYIIYMNMLHEHVLIIQWNNQAHVISLIVWFTYVQSMGKAITHAKLRRAVHSYGAMTLVGWNALMMFDDLNSHILALPSRCLLFPPAALKALRFRHEEVDQDWCFAHTSSYQHPSLQLVGRFGPEFTQCVDYHTLRKSMGPSVATFPWDTSQVPRA